MFHEVVKMLLFNCIHLYILRCYFRTYSKYIVYHINVQYRYTTETVDKVQLIKYNILYNNVYNNHRVHIFTR
jgi:hypothetical protein